MKKVIQIMLVAILANFAITAVNAQEEKTNLASNPSFEEWVEKKGKQDPEKSPKLQNNMIPRDWGANLEFYKENKENTGSVFRDDTIKHSGKSSVKIENKKPVNTTGVARWDIKVKPETTYKITIWTKGKDVKKAKDGVGAALWASSGPKKDFWSNKKGGYKFLKKEGSYDWTPLEIVFKTRPEDEMMIINAQLRWSSGTVWFDDIEVTEVK